MNLNLPDLVAKLRMDNKDLKAGVSEVKTALEGMRKEGEKPIVPKVDPSAAKRGAQEVSEAINQTGKKAPVIKPVVDTSGVKAEVSAASTVVTNFGKTAADSVGAGMTTAKAKVAEVSGSLNNMGNKPPIITPKVNTAPARREIDTVTKMLQGWGRMIAITSSIAMGVYTIKKAWETVVDAVEGYNMAVIQTAAFVTGMMEPQAGKSIADQYIEATAYAKNLADTMEVVDAKTVLTSYDLNLMSRELLKQGILLDSNNEKQIEGFTTLANAVAVISAGSPNKQVQLAQETRALLQGQVNQYSQLSQMLNSQVGDLKKEVALHKERGDLVEWLGEKLVGFNAASKDIENTWEGISSSMVTTFRQIVRGGLGPAFNDIIGNLGEMRDHLREDNEDLKKGLYQTWVMIKGVIETIDNVIEGPKDGMGEMRSATETIVDGWQFLLIAVFPALGKVLSTTFEPALLMVEYIIAKAKTINMNNFAKEYHKKKAIEEAEQSSLKKITAFMPDKEKAAIYKELENKKAAIELKFRPEGQDKVDELFNRWKKSSDDVVGEGSPFVMGERALYDGLVKLKQMQDWRPKPKSEVVDPPALKKNQATEDEKAIKKREREAAKLERQRLDNILSIAKEKQAYAELNNDVAGLFAARIEVMKATQAKELNETGLTADQKVAIEKRYTAEIAAIEKERDRYPIAKAAEAAEDREKITSTIGSIREQYKARIDTIRAALALELTYDKYTNEERVRIVEQAEAEITKIKREEAALSWDTGIALEEEKMNYSKRTGFLKEMYGSKLELLYLNQKKELMDVDKTEEERAAIAKRYMLEIEIARMESENRWLAGVSNGLRSYADDHLDLIDSLSGATSSAILSLEDQLTNFVMTGKFSFKDLANSIIADLARIAIQQTITAPLAAGLSGAISGMFGGWAGSGQGSFTSGDGSFSSTFATYKHSGGMVDGSGTSVRVPSSLFYNAPRFHSGLKLKSDEFPTILQRGEEVTSKADVVAGRLSGSGKGISQNIAIYEAPGTQATVQRDSNGDLSILIEKLQNAIAGDLNRGRSPINRAMESKYRLDKTSGMMR